MVNKCVAGYPSQARRALASSVPPRARAAVGNVAVRTQRVPLPLSLPLTKTFPYFVLSGFRCCYASLQARCGAPATPRDRTPVVVAACGVEAAPPAASSDSSRSSTGVTGYVTGLGDTLAKVIYGFLPGWLSREFVPFSAARSHRAQRASLNGSLQPRLQAQRAAAAPRAQEAERSSHRAPRPRAARNQRAPAPPQRWSRENVKRRT